MTERKRQRVEKALSPVNPDLPRFKLGEYGFVGLKQQAGHVIEQARRELRFPHNLPIYRRMAIDSVISSALSLYEAMITKVRWTIKEPENATEEQKFRTRFIKQCMNDMDHSWFSFITEVSSMVTYGFSVHELSWRYRKRENGSKFDDGLIGLKALPIRSQDSIRRWIFDDKNKKLIGVVQGIDNLEYSVYNNTVNNEIVIPRKKFLLFRTSATRDNPEGNSPLNSVYLSWKLRSNIQEQEAVGISRDLSGLPTIYIPPRYMSDDAAPAERAVFDYYKKMVSGIQNNEQAGLVLPQAFDPDSKQPLFKFELMGSPGSKTYNTSEIILRYNKEILTALFAHVLLLGQNETGSFSLASSQTSILAVGIQRRLNEIRDVLNHELVRAFYSVNNWQLDEELPTFEYEDLEQDDLDVFSKAVQRMAAVGFIERDREMMDRVRSILGVREYGEDEEVDEDSIPLNRTGAAGGMTSGMGNGQSTSVAYEDNSLSNMEN